MNVAAIQAAFHGVVCRGAEMRTDRAGRAVLQFIMRLGEGDNALFAAVRSRRPEAIARSAQFSPGALVHAEGSLFLNRKINATGDSTIVLDLDARSLTVIGIGRRAMRAATAAAAALPADGEAAL